MEKSETRNLTWDIASKAGLALGGVSIAYLLVNMFMPTTQSIGVGALISLLGIALWAAKFFGCIWLMKFFMKKLVAADPETTNSDTFRLGMIIAVLSALIYAAFYLLYTSVISPDIYSESLALIQEQYAGMMPAESLEAIENINFPVMGFFTQLFYCSVFGIVLSAILSRNIPENDPFADYKSNQNTNENL